VAVRCGPYAPVHRPSARAAATSASPPGRIRPAAVRAATFATSTCDHVLRGRRRDPQPGLGPLLVVHHQRSLPARLRHPAGSRAWPYSARVRLHASAEVVAEHDRITPAAGLLIPVDAHSCILETGSRSLRDLVGHLTGLDVGFDVLEPPELRTLLREPAGRYAAAARYPYAVPGGRGRHRPSGDGVRGLGPGERGGVRRVSARSCRGCAA
jgi:hypothetical protein